MTTEQSIVSTGIEDLPNRDKFRDLVLHYVRTYEEQGPGYEGANYLEARLFSDFYDEATELLSG